MIFSWREAGGREPGDDRARVLQHPRLIRQLYAHHRILQVAPLYLISVFLIPSIYTLTFDLYALTSNMIMALVVGPPVEELFLRLP